MSAGVAVSFEIHVAPFAGAGIEILSRLTFRCGGPVAPFAGAGIEIGENAYERIKTVSPPSRGRELK